MLIAGNYPIEAVKIQGWRGWPQSAAAASFSSSSIRPPADLNLTLPVNPTAHPATPMVTFFEGGSALSEFRARQLLPKLQAVEPRIEGLSARFIHLVATDAAPDAQARERFAALLSYGEPFAAPAKAGPTL